MSVASVNDALAGWAALSASSAASSSRLQNVAAISSPSGRKDPKNAIALARRELAVEAREISNLDRGFLYRGAPMGADRHKDVLVGVAGLLPRFLGRHVGGEHFVEASAASVALLDEAVARGGAELRRHLQQPVELLDLEFKVLLDNVDQILPSVDFHSVGAGY